MCDYLDQGSKLIPFARNLKEIKIMIPHNYCSHKQLLDTRLTLPLSAAMGTRRAGGRAIMKLKARNAHPSRRECACPRATPLLEAMLQQRWQVAASLGRTHLCAVSGQGLLRGSVIHVALTSRLPQCARNSDLNITTESRLKSSCWGKISMIQGELRPRGKAEG